MSTVTLERSADSIVVRSEFWTVEHSLAKAGAIHSIRFAHGTGKNLLAGPISSFVRFHKLDASEDYGVYPLFTEANDTKAHVRTEQSADGFPIVIAEGVYTDAQGQTIPVGFRRSTEYREYGLLWSTLEIMSQAGCDGVVHVRAFDASFRPGLTDFYARPHPVVLNSSDLCASGDFRRLPEEPGTAFSSRYTPLHLILFERGADGIELFPASELAGWDLSLKPDLGLGLHQIHHSDKGTQVELDPYCMAFRRRTIRLQGHYTFKLGIGLPAVKPARSVQTGPFHGSLNSEWATDTEIARLANAGVKLIRFHNDFANSGIFWRDGMYPPYDEKGMRELRRVIDTCHAHGMKIVPYVSLKEFHPDSPGYAENERAWMHMVAPSVDPIHTFIGNGEFGGLMCMRSGWLDFRKRSVETILSDLPWDGLYFDWCVPHPCCHPGHARGPFHNDVDEVLDFLLFCRRRVGTDGILFMHLSGVPSIVAENMANLAFIHEDIGNVIPLPGQYPAQHSFCSIVPRHIVVSGPPGSAAAARFTIGGLLEGHPACTHAPPKEFSLQMLHEMELFHDASLATMRFSPASERKIATGVKQTFASAWADADRLLLYVGNLTDKPAKGKLRFPGVKSWFAGKTQFTVERRDPARPFLQAGPGVGKKGKPKAPAKITVQSAGRLAATELAKGGLPWQLPPQSSCLFVLKVR
ncbi:MAG TPA: hypothetical protein VL860_02455 [Planctomycetota bacterium]|nr:hypothetical protein [Planctomycetota bacterium]